MFRLPEESDFFQKKIELTVPIGKKEMQAAFHAKYKYLSQEKLWEVQELFNQLPDADNEEKRQIEEEVLDTILYGFSDVYVGERELDDSDKKDVDWLIRTGSFSRWFREAIVDGFFESYTTTKSHMSKVGNSSARRSTGRK